MTKSKSETGLVEELVLPLFALSLYDLSSMSQEVPEDEEMKPATSGT